MTNGLSVRKLRSAAELAAACADDPLCMWAAQGPLDRDEIQAWAAGPEAAGQPAAVAVACPGLSLRNRIAVWGEPGPATELMARVLPLLGPSYRPLGDSGLITELCARLPGLTMSEPFGWMYTRPRQPVPAEPSSHRRDEMTSPGTTPGRAGVKQAAAPPGEPRWLADREMAAVTALLDRSFPDSYARPGRPGVRRWAGIDGPDGELAAVAADAWSAPTVGFMAGVAVREELRGTGLGGRICRFLADRLIAGHGRVALMVDGWNDPAIRLYRRLGLTRQEIRAAWAGPAVR
jgi:ribosomal protein S18 acetylase RimI-like enzyme